MNEEEFKILREEVTDLKYNLIKLSQEQIKTNLRIHELESIHNSNNLD